MELIVTDLIHKINILILPVAADRGHCRPDRQTGLARRQRSTLKATTVLAMLNWLGVKPSYSRPRVSDDNAYAESLFGTAKYRPEFPVKGLADLAQARA